MNIHAKKMKTVTDERMAIMQQELSTGHSSFADGLSRTTAGVVKQLPNFNQPMGDGALLDLSLTMEKKAVEASEQGPQPEGSPQKGGGDLPPFASPGKRPAEGRAQDGAAPDSAKKSKVDVASFRARKTSQALREHNSEHEALVTAASDACRTFVRSGLDFQLDEDYIKNLTQRLQLVLGVCGLKANFSDAASARVVQPSDPTPADAAQDAALQQEAKLVGSKRSGESLLTLASFAGCGEEPSFEQIFNENAGGLAENVALVKALFKNITLMPVESPETCICSAQAYQQLGTLRSATDEESVKEKYGQWVDIKTSWGELKTALRKAGSDLNSSCKERANLEKKKKDKEQLNSKKKAEASKKESAKKAREAYSIQYTVHSMYHIVYSI